MAPDQVRDPAYHDAEERGRRRAELEARLDGHDREIGTLREGHAEIRLELRHLVVAQDKLTDKITGREAVQQALAESAEKAVSRQITRREFWVAAGLLLVTLLGVLVAVVATLK